jgi:hypothetical protein
MANITQDVHGNTSHDAGLLFDAEYVALVDNMPLTAHYKERKSTFSSAQTKCCAAQPRTTLSGQCAKRP